MCRSSLSPRAFGATCTVMRIVVTGTAWSIEVLGYRGASPIVTERRYQVDDECDGWMYTLNEMITKSGTRESMQEEFEEMYLEARHKTRYRYVITTRIVVPVPGGYARLRWWE